ncbi:hypothetical protein ACHAXA_008720 [Cyclostephanos tholiformis]|uniref:Uncharacterized protein n=1 Tax=Cyclostephanos tholiformis TaxID=382380 RepID=A0ABD3RG16_9STRA
MHIDSALRGVGEEERCPGWQTGKCPLLGEKGGGPCKFECPDCGMKMQASTAPSLSEVVDAHKNRGIFALGESQCAKRIAGKI